MYTLQSALRARLEHPLLLLASRACRFGVQGFASRGFRVQGLGFRQSSKRVLASAALIASAETVSCVSGASTLTLVCAWRQHSHSCSACTVGWKETRAES